MRVFLGLSLCTFRCGTFSLSASSGLFVCPVKYGSFVVYELDLARHAGCFSSCEMLFLAVDRYVSKWGVRLPSVLKSFVVQSHITLDKRGASLCSAQTF